MNRMMTMTVVGALALAGCLTQTRSAGPAYVDEFDLSASSCGYGKKVCKLEGKRGFYSHPESAVVFHSNGKVAAFDAVVGIPKGSKSPYPTYGKAGLTVRIWADDKIVATYEGIRAGETPKKVHVDLKGAKTIILETRSGGLWNDFVAADCNWVDARFTCEDGATLESETDEAIFAQLGRLTPEEKPEPQFNGADIWGVRPGHPVIFRIPVSGVKPIKFTAQGLPAGVTMDARGVLRGTAPKAKGDYDIVVTAVNKAGKAMKTIRLAVGDTIALTPPMGWNSWNVWGFGLTAERAKASALAMEQSGLGDYGWAYINLDDWWEMNNSGVNRVETRMKDLGLKEPDCTGPARDAKGKINPNRSFPDMKGLTDYIHAFGFKAGLYSSPGYLTCGSCEGSLGHELQDAESWAEWGFDYIKYDWCYYSREVGRKMGNEKWQWYGDKNWIYNRNALNEEPYFLMRDCLRKQNRDILYSFCQYGMGKTELWGREAGANCWRTFDDLKDGWAWMDTAIESRINAEFWKYCGKGFWPDPDMMIIGQQRSFGHDHPTFLTPNEQYTHVSVWAMLSAPLLTGCDLTKLDDFTRSLLVNREIIALSQDRAGNVARRVVNTDAEAVWYKTLENGDAAIAIVNRSPILRQIKVDLKALGLCGSYKVRDCWRQADEEKATDSYFADILPHATKVIRLSKIDCRKCE